MYHELKDSSAWGYFFLKKLEKYVIKQKHTIKVKPQGVLSEVVSCIRTDTNGKRASL